MTKTNSDLELCSRNCFALSFIFEIPLNDFVSNPRGTHSKETKNVTALPIYLLPHLSCRSGKTVLQIGDDGERAGDHRIRNLVHNATPMRSTPRRGEGLLRLLPCPAPLLHKINITSTTIDTSTIVDIIAITTGELTMMAPIERTTASHDRAQT